MKKLLSMFLAGWLVLASPLAAAVRGEKAMYVEGTVSAIPEKQQGILDTSGDSALVFRWQKGNRDIPYSSITAMAYGKQVGRRVGAAAATTAAAGVGGLFLLLSKKKKHYLTLRLKDEAGQEQVAVFELSKGTYEAIIADLEEKTGLKLQFEAEEPAKR